MARELDVRRLSELLSQKLGRAIDIREAAPAGGGYHSDGFKLHAADGQTFFLKRVKSHDLGFEFPERKVMSLLVGQGMGQRSGLEPHPIGIVLSNAEEEVILPEVNEETEIYHIQECALGSISYWELLQAKKQKTAVDAGDRVEVDKVVDLIRKVHAVKFPSSDIARQTSVYNDGLRSILTHPELTLMFLQDFGPEHPIFPSTSHGVYIGHMLDMVQAWKDRPDRLCALHGDFWGANLFFREDGSPWLIDYSRIPWGDPAIDVGWWLSQYLWAYHETGHTYFQELGEYFLTRYQEQAQDAELRQKVCLVLGLLGIINITPRFYPNLDLTVGTKFFDTIRKIISTREFTW